MDFTNILALLGGLALFLYGMNTMGSALEKRAGNKLKSILASLTSSPAKGFMLGLGITAIIQSSSATTVMVVGFVNSGIMTLHQASGVIFGANLGTSVTSWILSLTGIEGDTWWISMFKPESFTPVLAFIGMMMFMFSKKQRIKDTAMILLGFAILMFGMETMSDSVAPLADIPEFRNVLVLFSNPVLGVLVGTIFTAVIQSSSASVGILQALTMTGSVSYATAVPIIMGQNIGTCVSALISSIGTTKNAKRAAIIHLSFNLIATLILLPAYYLLTSIVTVPFLQGSADPLGIAIVHTVFKLLALAIIMPFSKQLEKIACFLAKDAKNDKREQLLDDRLLATPSVAIERCKVVAREMSGVAIGSLKKAMNLIGNYNEAEAQQIRDEESVVDGYEDTIGTYLVKLSSQRMSEADSSEATKLLHIIGDFERISDHAVNILESAEEMHDKKLSLSDEAKREMRIMLDAINEIIDLAQKAFGEDDVESAMLVEPLEEVVDYLRDTLKKRHISRLQRNECTIEMGFVLSDLLINLERVSDHCSNIGGCIIEMAHDSLGIHEYQNRIKDGESEFKNNYDYYRTKYAVYEG